MKHLLKASILILSAIFIISCSGVRRNSKATQQPDSADKFHASFVENFNDSTSPYFRHSSGGKGADFTWAFGANSKTDAGKKILSLKIDPEDMAGAGRGPDISSKKFTYFGTYSASIKVPDVRNIQPNVGAVVGYFTYNMDKEFGLSEIDFEWLIADPTIIYVGTWTGPRDSLKRIGRTINMAEGVIYETIYREDARGERKALTGEQNQPAAIAAIKDYDASSQFYTYGFDWHADRVRWWMIHPETGDKIILWDYHGIEVGIPQNYSRYLMNFWHTNNWSVETNPNSIEKPAGRYELEVDWMSYEPVVQPSY